MENLLQGICNRVDEAKNQISDLDYEEMKTPNQNSIKRKSKINQDSVRSLWDNVKCTTFASWGCQKETRERN